MVCCYCFLLWAWEFSVFYAHTRKLVVSFMTTSSMTQASSSKQSLQFAYMQYILMFGIWNDFPFALGAEGKHRKPHKDDPRATQGERKLEEARRQINSANRSALAPGTFQRGEKSGGLKRGENRLREKPLKRPCHESELWKSKAGVLVYKGVGWKLIWPRDRIDISKERALHPPPPPTLELIRGDMLGMVLGCHEGRSVTMLSLLKDRHVLVVHNFIETANSHEHKCNRHFRKLLARLRDIHSKDSSHSCTTDITSYTEVLTLHTLARSQFQLIFTTELLGMVFACHEGTIGYDRLLLKDRHVLVVHNFTETGNSHEHKCDRHFRKLLARLRDTHWGFARHSLGHSHALFGTAFEL